MRNVKSSNILNLHLFPRANADPPAFMAAKGSCAAASKALERAEANGRV